MDKEINARIRERLEELNVPVVLTGMMGAGKTHIGRKLAEALGLDFFDLDREIEKAANCSVRDIFEYYGEKAFRDVEKRVLRRLIARGISVISLGGGAIADEQTRKLIKQKALLIWLDADINVLYQRVKGSTHRPLLQQDNPEEKLKELAQKREKYYSQSHLRVDSNHKSPSQTLRLMIKELESFLES